MSQDVYNKEKERPAIVVNWKSYQIEGNTYSLPETERLLNDKETVAWKPKDDADFLWTEQHQRFQENIYGTIQVWRQNLFLMQ